MKWGNCLRFPTKGPLSPHLIANGQSGEELPQPHSCHVQGRAQSDGVPQGHGWVPAQAGKG